MEMNLPTAASGMSKGKKILIGVLGAGVAISLLVILFSKKSSAATSEMQNTNNPDINGEVDNRKIDKAGMTNVGATHLQVGDEVFAIPPPIEGGIGFYKNKPKIA